VAEVAEFTTTAVTLAPAVLASPDPAWALMIAENLSPFCSSEIFFAAPVWPLKNASQLVVICALALPPAAAGAELLGAVLLAGGLLAGAEGEAADEDGAGADALADGAAAVEELELLQAAAVAVRARPITGTAIRRARSWNRIKPPRSTVLRTRGILRGTDVLA
jgi:hypothetical protein